MSYLLPHLHSGYAVDQAILGEEDRVVVIRFGHDWDPHCMQVSLRVFDVLCIVLWRVCSEESKQQSSTDTEIVCAPVAQRDGRCTR